MWPQLFTCKDSWLIRNGPCGTLIRENEKNVTYVTVTWIWSHLINSTRVNFECKKRKNLNKMKSNQYSHHHVHLQISLCLTFICTGMNVHNHSNDTRFFHALWSLCSFNHFPVARCQCLPITHMSLEETELWRQRLEILWFWICITKLFPKVLYQAVQHLAGKYVQRKEILGGGTTKWQLIIAAWDYFLFS